jgi:hypothetical protein
MIGLLPVDIEPLEEITRDEHARALFLRMAKLRRTGQTPRFLAELADDPDVDESMKGPLAEIAQDTEFLLALEDYVHRTQHVH